MTATNRVLARYAQDKGFRDQIIAVYVNDRPRFISWVISLAVSEGYGRAESVAFAKAVCARIQVEAAVTDLTPGPPCNSCGESPARLFPCGWRCDEHAPAFGGAYTPMKPAPRIRSLTAPGPCRFCRRPSWGTDDLGPVHPCCLAWRYVIAAGYPCPSCQVSEIVLRQPTHHPDGTIRQVRLPELPPLPRFLPDGTPYVPEL